MSLWNRLFGSKRDCEAPADGPAVSAAPGSGTSSSAQPGPADQPANKRSHGLFWRARPIFVSSTFRDMHRERDHLRTHAFRALAERMRERCHYLDVIDLRQGIENAQEAERAVRDEQVLKVCLDEIQRSRPFMIVLLGDRYGWIPPAERITAAAQAAGMADSVELAGCSVTELEILHGVLANPEQAKRSWFYFRRLDSGGMPEEVAARFSAEERSDVHDSPFRRLERLKTRIQEQLPDRVRHYNLRWNAQRGDLSGLEDLDQMVVRDLGADLEIETADFLRHAPRTRQESEMRELTDFVAEHSRCHVERPSVTGPMIEHALSAAATDGKWGLLITGGPGSGKSGLFASVFTTLQKKAAAGELILLAHAAGISATSVLVDSMLRRWVAELAATLGLSDPMSEAPDSYLARVATVGQADRRRSESVERAFAELLAMAAERRRVVVLVDALNQFETSARASRLTWLPKSWPANARLLATTITDCVEGSVFTECRTFEVPAINRDEALAIARLTYRTRYHRDVNPRVLDVVLGRQANGRPAYASPLWLGLALQEMNLLEADDFARADREFASLPEAARLEALQVSEATRLPPEVPGIYGELLDRAERSFGVEWTRTLTSLLALGRAGWREGDLRAHLVRDSCGVEWDDARFASVRRELGSHLTQRGAQAQWDFFHPILREAVLQRNLCDLTLRRRLHALLAQHLQALPADDSLRVSETMVHLLGLGERTRAATYLAGLPFGSAERTGAAAAIVQAIEGGIRTGDASEVVEWLRSLLDEPGLSSSQIENITSVMLFDIDEGLRTRQLAEPARQLLLESSSSTLEALERAGTVSQTGLSILPICYCRLARLWTTLGDGERTMKLWKCAVAKSTELYEASPRDAARAITLSGAYQGLGDTYGSLGDKTTALQFHQKALEIARRLNQVNRSNPLCTSLVSDCLAGIATIHMDRGDRAQALGCLQECLQLRRSLCETSPDDDDYARGLGVAWDRLGNFYRDFGSGRLAQGGDPERAMECYRRSLEVAEGLRRKNPHNAADARGVSIACSKLGELCMEGGGFPEAHELYRRDLEIAEELQRRNPRSAGAARDLSVTLVKHGDLYAMGGSGSVAIEFYEKALAIRDGLHRLNPDAVGPARDLLAVYERLGKVHHHSRNVKAAQATFAKALALGERLLQVNAASGDTTWVVASLQTAMGRVLEPSDPGAALSQFEKALASLSGLVAEGRLTDQRGRQTLEWLRAKIAQMHVQRGEVGADASLRTPGQRPGTEAAANHGTSPDRAARWKIVTALMNKGTMLDRAGLSQEEVDVYDEVLARFGDDRDPSIRAEVAGALLNRALTYGQLGRVDEELESYRELVRRFGSDSESRTRERVAGALLNLGCVLEDRGRSREAALAYDDLLARFGEAMEPAIRPIVAKALGFRTTIGRVR